MPKIKGYATNIPRLYKWQALDNICFGYVMGLRVASKEAGKEISVSEGVRRFLEAFDLCEDTYCFDNAKAGYYRVLQSLIEVREGWVEDVGNIIID